MIISNKNAISFFKIRYKHTTRIHQNNLPCHIAQATTFVNYNKANYFNSSTTSVFFTFTITMLLPISHCKSFLSTSPQSASNITPSILLPPSNTPTHLFFSKSTLFPCSSTNFHQNYPYLKFFSFSVFLLKSFQMS